MNDYSLLPDNRSPLERGLELAFTQLLYESDNPYPKLLSPDKTDSELLPYLAQERGAIGWASAENEREKRAVTKLAWSIRQLAGTKAGIKSALSTLGLDSDVMPWHELGQFDSPYRLSIRVYSEDKPIGQDFSRDIGNIISQVVSERDEVGVTLALSTNVIEEAAAAMHSGTVSETYPYRISDIQSDTPITWASCAQNTYIGAVYPPDAVSTTLQALRSIAVVTASTEICEIKPKE